VEHTREHSAARRGARQLHAAHSRIQVCPGQPRRRGAQGLAGRGRSGGRADRGSRTRAQQRRACSAACAPQSKGLTAPGDRRCIHAEREQTKEVPNRKLSSPHDCDGCRPPRSERRGACGGAGVVGPLQFQ